MDGNFDFIQQLKEEKRSFLPFVQIDTKIYSRLFNQREGELQLMGRRLTIREKIGYQGEKKAVEILKNEGYAVELWLHRKSKVGQEPYDIVGRKGSIVYLIDVKSSSSDKRKLPIHDHSLVDLINVAKKESKTPMILVVKPSSYSLINPYDLLSGAKLKDVYLYHCKLRKQKQKDIKDLLESRARLI